MELQELVSRARFIFANSRARLKIFELVNGRDPAKAIAKKVKRRLSSTLRDLQQLRDVELIRLKLDRAGNPVKKDNSMVYEKVPLARHIPPSYFRDSTRAARKLAKATSVQKRRGRVPRPRPLAIPGQTEILDICKAGEDHVYEFKRPGTEVRKITKEIAAFLHTERGGIIFYGVDDDGVIAGTDIARQRLDQQVQNSVRNTISPSPGIHMRSSLVLGTELILIQVPPWNRRTVYFYEGRVYVRKGTNVFEANPEEVRRLHGGEIID